MMVNPGSFRQQDLEWPCTACSSPTHLALYPTPGAAQTSPCTVPLQPLLFLASTASAKPCNWASDAITSLRGNDPQFTIRKALSMLSGPVGKVPTGLHNPMLCPGTEGGQATPCDSPMQRTEQKMTQSTARSRSA